jgi:hypothetical protein
VKCEQEIVSILEQSPVSLSRTKIDEACAPELAIREALFVHRSKARRRPVRPGAPERTREALALGEYEFLANRIFVF